MKRHCRRNHATDGTISIGLEADREKFEQTGVVALCLTVLFADFSEEPIQKGEMNDKFN